jgi:hypothetical protein
MNAATERASVRRLSSSSRRTVGGGDALLYPWPSWPCSAWAACRDVRVYITRPQASGERVSAGLSPTALTAVRTPRFTRTPRATAYAPRLAWGADEHRVCS